MTPGRTILTPRGARLFRALRLLRYVVAAALVSGALGSGGFAPLAAQAANPLVPLVTISPLKDTPDASPTTQISFLGTPPADISQIVVRGSHSGIHAGTLEPYSTGTGASFVPAVRFTTGEQVTVTAVETAPGVSVPIGTRFRVGHLYAAPPEPQTKELPQTPGSVLSFSSEPDLHPPSVNVKVPAVDPTAGDVFTTPKDGAAQPGAMIVSPTGQLIWFAPSPGDEQAADLQVQQYLGQTVLTYWQGVISLNHGVGSGIIDNTSYQTIATVHAGNGLSMDLHDFELGAGGVAYTTIYEPVYANLTSVGGSPHGLIDDCVIQEIDVHTGLVMFEWHALGHVALSDSHWPVPDSAGKNWDWFHINMVDAEPNGDILINSRNTWAAYQLSPAGNVLWSLGGHHSSFKLGPGVRFAWQHDTTLLPDGTVQIFDNEDDPEVEHRSRGIDIGLDYATHTATLLHQYTTPGDPVLANSQGNVQQLPNGDHLLGWGAVGLVSELSPAGAATFEMTYPHAVVSYRAFRFPWTATPTSLPALAATRAAGATSTSIEASWNGATSVVSWQPLAGTTATALAPAGAPVPAAGFETAITVASTAPFVAVQAIGAGGTVLGTSTPIAPSAS
jgi:hypothetical protein